MKEMKLIRKIPTAVTSFLILAIAGIGQTTAPKQTDGNGVSAKDAKTIKTIPLPAPTVTSADGKTTDENLSATSEADEILPYYSNYLKEYRLGPNDQISVEVFGQCPDYCKMGITIPPTARMSYPLIREGIMVAGKTVEQIADEITKKLDEFIIDPKVTVTLDKAMSARYSVMGKVVAPGIRVMDRKVSVYEAILESGGVAKNGSRNNVAIISYGSDGRLTKRMVNLAQMESGKAEIVYLNPGDQVFVAGKGFSIDKVFDIIGKTSFIRLLFGSPF